MGSKNKYAKDILPIILSQRSIYQSYIEPFAGGMNTIDKVDGRRWANDSHSYLIAMWNALLYKSWNPPLFVSESLYEHVKTNPNNYETELVGYIGFNSYGAKWFGGYRRDKEGKRDYWREHYNNIQIQRTRMYGVSLTCGSYLDMEIPNNSVVYCDPPYKETTKYASDFSHEVFWDWVRQIGEHNPVFVSEYQAPDDFECLWQKRVNNTLAKDTGSKQGIEKLFRRKQ